jgi:hemoglobin-like flavoprotein
MKINRFNAPDFSNFNNDVKVANNSVNSVANSTVTNDNSIDQPAASPLMTQMREIAQVTNLNDAGALSSAIDQIARKMVSSLVSPEMARKIDMDKMLATIAEFAQNDPTISQKIQRMLVRVN